MFAWIQQYVLYALGSAIVVGVVAFGVQTYRLNDVQNDLTLTRS